MLPGKRRRWAALLLCASGVAPTEWTGQGGMKHDSYFVPVLMVVAVVCLGGLLVLTTTRSRESPPDHPDPPPDPTEILRVTRAPEADDVGDGAGSRVAFRVKNVSNGTVSAAVITIALLDQDQDAIRRFSISLGSATGHQRGCDAPLRPGEYCLHKEVVQAHDYRRMASFTARVSLPGQ